MSRRRADLYAAAAAAALFALAALAGGLLGLAGRPVHAGAAPLFAHWLPHLGPGTPLAAAVAVLVCRYGSRLAARLRWRTLLAVSYLTAVAWTLSLALVDGWQRGVAGRLTTGPEYLTEVPGVTSVPAMLRGFSGRILDHQPDSWTTHVAGHPPGALLVFVGLDRLGLSGGAWAGLLCVAVGALTAVAVPATVRLAGSDRAGRAATPFVALFPGAVWVGVSADGLFAGVTATGIGLFAYGLARRSALAAFAGGLLLGASVYLSYGMVLIFVIVAAVVLAVPHGRRTAGWAMAGVVVVVVAFTAAGFDWLTGYHLVTRRYYQGLAAHRPYAYWVWANLAALTVAAGPIAAVILRRATPRLSLRTAGAAPWLLPVAAAAAILAADLTGYSKAEVERIWLPFAVWLMAGAALVPARPRRWWLAGQAVVALVVNHLLLTVW
ncbi:hypothetical protein ACQPZX_34785 [Actinoplanes sp. CA-142083]|uniref:hypothetical protein n=1 Tax=Actinoplanes sp. CA-142083 TaxID=3239903 RepID=UPI003D8B1D13